MAGNRSRRRGAVNLALAGGTRHSWDPILPCYAKILRQLRRDSMPPGVGGTPGFHYDRSVGDRIVTWPNVLSAARLAGVPVFLWLVLGPRTATGDIIAAAVLGL